MGILISHPNTPAGETRQEHRSMPFGGQLSTFHRGYPQDSRQGADSSGDAEEYRGCEGCDRVPQR